MLKSISRCLHHHHVPRSSFYLRVNHLCHRHRYVLGIETSCDDTGAAIVDECGTVLGEALNSQKDIHIANGGIIPPLARDLHVLHLDRVVKEVLQQSKIPVDKLDAIATTVKPGLALSLVVGMKYGKELSRSSGVPFIPIHHMEAHALTARMIDNVPFPYLVLLISGGHCILCLARDVGVFLVLGSSLDDAPGEAFDKTARRLKLTNIPECSRMSGGQAIEYLAKWGNPNAFDLTVPMNDYRDCNFSFSGIKFGVLRCLLREEKKFEIEADGVLPNVTDICASFQLTVARHLLKRLQRAIMFCDTKNFFSDSNRTLVVSGGVASNVFIRKILKQLCDEMSVRFLCPPQELCTDNGIMIAWNGMERLKVNLGITRDLDSVDIEAKCPLGTDISEEVIAESIKLPRFKINLDDL